MSPPLDFALTENSARTTTETTRTPGASSGTNGSNPILAPRHHGGDTSLAQLAQIRIQ